MILLEALGVVLMDKFKIMWHAFELFKDAYFVNYMGRKQEAHKADEGPALLITINKLLKFSLDKYTDQYQINNHVWGSLYKREVEFFPLTYEVTTLKGNLKLADKISKKQNPKGGVVGAAPK